MNAVIFASEMGEILAGAEERMIKRMAFLGRYSGQQLDSMMHTPVSLLRKYEQAVADIIREENKKGGNPNASGRQ